MITITFGDQAENHVGMQKIGQLANEGFTPEDLLSSKEIFEQIGATTEYIDLIRDDIISDKPAGILVVRNAVNVFKNCFDLNFDQDDLYNELVSLDWDKKALMRGRVVNKIARWNLCFSNENQEPDYEIGNGRIISWNDVPCLRIIRNLLPEFFNNDKAKDLECEGNYYYDPKKCYIGYHGDTERKKVIAFRLSSANSTPSFPIYYQWYYKSEKVGEPITIPLNSGDMYIMSEKAVGTDWKKRNTYTLRHATGLEKNI